MDQYFTRIMICLIGQIYTEKEKYSIFCEQSTSYKRLNEHSQLKTFFSYLGVSFLSSSLGVQSNLFHI